MICKICLEEANEARITVCGHIFCEACIFQWIRSNGGLNPSPIFNCPVCRKSLDRGKDIIVVYQDLNQPDGERRAKKGAERERERLVDGDGAEVPAFLQKIAKQWTVLETENKVLRLKVSDLEAEVSFLKGLKQGEADRRGESDSKESDSEKSVANMKENHDPRVDTTAPTKVMKELKKPTKIYKRHTGPIHGISISSSGSLVASASWDGTCQVYDLQSDRTTQVLQHENGLYAVDFAPKMELFLATASSETCVLWSADTGRRLRRLDEHKDEINGLRFAPKGQYLATASADCTCREWDVETGTSINLFRGHQSEVYGVSYSPDKPLIATASFDKTCKVWDTGAPDKAIRTLEGHKDSVIGCHIHPDGNLVATGSDDKTCRLWDIRTWQCLAVLHHHEGDVKRVKFSNGGAFLATTSGDKSVRIYSIASLHCVRILNAHSDHVFDVAWSPKDDFIVSASHDQQWNLWEPNLNKVLK